MARGYNTYHGRKTRWKGILAAALIIIIIVAVGVIWAQQFLVYDDEGNAYWVFSLHNQNSSEEVLSSSESGTNSAESADTSADGASSSASGSGSTSVEEEPPTEPVEPVVIPMQAISLSGDSSGWEAIIAAQQQEQKSYCITVRETGGLFQYQSSVDGATMDSGAMDTAVLAALNAAEDRYAIARLSCLQDNQLYKTRANISTMCLQNTRGNAFYDADYHRWLDPSKEAAINYLCSIALECAALGFDEILLTDVTYPTAGELTKINYNGAEPAAALQNMVSAITAAVTASYPAAKVSVELPSSVILTGADETAGLSLTGMVACTSRIYTVTTAADYPTLASMVTAVNANAVLIPELTGETLTENDYLQLS